MEGSFSFDRRQNDASVPRRNQFAPERPVSAVFHDPAVRRHYIEQQEREFTPLSEKLAEMHRREEGARLAEENRLENAEIADRYARSLDWQYMDDANDGNPVNALDQELDELARSLERTPRKRSEGEYAAASPHRGPTYSDSRAHTNRIHLGPDQKIRRQVNEQLEAVQAQRIAYMQERDQKDARYSQRATNEWRAMDHELKELERSLEELKAEHLQRATHHGYGIDDAALTSPDQPFRSHVPKPIKPRGDGRSIRTWDEV